MFKIFCFHEWERLAKIRDNTKTVDDYVYTKNYWVCKKCDKVKRDHGYESIISFKERMNRTMVSLGYEKLPDSLYD